MMLRRIMFVLFSGLLVLAPSVAALAQDEEVPIDECPTDHVPETTWTCPTELVGSADTLTWFNWATYEAACTRRDFATLCGLQEVAEVVMGSNEDLISKVGLGNPGYDVATPTGTVIPQMIREELIQPIDLSKIPNFANVSEFLQGPAYDPENEYSVPYQWGSFAIGYNVEAVGKEITSWEDVWSYTGNVAWINDPRFMMGIALHLLGFDPNSTNPEEIEAARIFLFERSSNVRALADDNGQEYLLSGEADIVLEYSGDIYQIIAECEADPELDCAGKYAYVIPEEGGLVWVDNLVLLSGAPQPELALAFMDYILDPLVGADISNYTAFSSPNQASIDLGLISEELLNNPIINPDPEVSARLFDIVDVGDAASVYTEQWTLLRTMLGQ